MNSSLNNLNTTNDNERNAPGLVDIHPKGWTKNEHYSSFGDFCGQSCPCCRAHFKDFGSCPICLKQTNIIENDPDSKQSDIKTQN